MEAYARNRFVFFSDSAAKQPQTSEQIALNATSGCHSAVAGSSAVVSSCRTNASTATFTGSMKNAVMGSGLPS